MRCGYNFRKNIHYAIHSKIIHHIVRNVKQRKQKNERKKEKKINCTWNILKINSPRIKTYSPIQYAEENLYLKGFIEFIFKKKKETLTANFNFL